MTKIPKSTFYNLSPDKQERITLVAMEEFSNKGFNGASINAMVERLRIAKGSIFQYFGDKKGLFVFVFNRSLEMVKDYLKTVRSQSAESDLQTRLTHTLFAGIRFIRQHPLLYRLYLRVLFESKAPFRDEILASLRSYSFEYLRSLLEAARDKGELKQDLDLDKACFILDAVMDRFLQALTVAHLDAGLGVYSASIDSAENWSKSLVETICRGITQQGVTATTDRSYILISAAVDQELFGLQKEIKDHLESNIGGRRLVSGNLYGIAVRLLTTGPGMVNTAQALTAAIETEAKRPALILQTGCAGAFAKSGLRLGDIALATEEIDAAAGIENPADACQPDDLPFVVLENQSGQYKNRFPLDLKAVNAAYQVLAAEFSSSEIKVKKGRFITGSTITATDRRAESLYKNFKPCMEQMEGSAAAHVAALYEIPFLEIRAASNLVGERNKASWDLDAAVKNSTRAILLLIRHLEDETLRRLIIKKENNLIHR